MRGVNKVIILGNVGADPDTKVFPNGQNFCKVSLCTNKTWTDKTSGEKKSSTTWHLVCFYGRSAEIIGAYVKKGDRLFVEGELSCRKYTDKNNIDRVIYEVKARDFNLLGNEEGKLKEPTLQESSTSPPPTDEQELNDDIPF